MEDDKKTNKRESRSLSVASVFHETIQELFDEGMPLNVEVKIVLNDIALPVGGIGYSCINGKDTFIIKAYIPEN